MSSNNLSALTASHTAIAAKKRKKREQIKEVVFDESARREFLTGFHKRKLAKAEAARKKAQEREKLDRQAARREQRRELRERAIENAAQVESAYHALLDQPTNGDVTEDDEWAGISSEEKGKQKQEQYETEETLATVTVVEDLDPDTFIHGPGVHAETSTNDYQSELPPPSKLAKRRKMEMSSNSQAASEARSKKKVRYQTKAERKTEQKKQFARKKEKAERAGGKSARPKGKQRTKSLRASSSAAAHNSVADDDDVVSTMNSLYTSGVRQTNSLQADIERLRNGDHSSALIGQISASLAAMHRTIDDYDSMAKREMIKAKQEKAQMRVQKFRTDYADLRSQFETLKAEQAANQRSELLSTSASIASPSAADARRRFQHTPSNGSTLHPGLRPQQSEISESPFRGPTPDYTNRDAHALREHSFINDTNQRLDDFLAQGREVLDNLTDQRNMLKGTQRRLLDTANTLGLSRDVIGWIERRSTQDMYIFFGGAIFTFFCFYLILKYLG